MKTTLKILVIVVVFVGGAILLAELTDGYGHDEAANILISMMIGSLGAIIGLIWIDK